MQILTGDCLACLECIICPFGHTNITDLLVGDLLVSVDHAMIQPVQEPLSVCSPRDIADPLLGQQLPFVLDGEVLGRTFLLIDPGPQLLGAKIFPLWDSHRCDLLIPEDYFEINMIK